MAKDQKCIVEISEPFLNEKDASIDSIIGQAKLSDVSYSFNIGEIGMDTQIDLLPLTSAGYIDDDYFEIKKLPSSGKFELCRGESLTEPRSAGFPLYRSIPKERPTLRGYKLKAISPAYSETQIRFGVWENEFDNGKPNLIVGFYPQHPVEVVYLGTSNIDWDSAVVHFGVHGESTLVLADLNAPSGLSIFTYGVELGFNKP
ncbi:MAG: hypothetical protein ABL924_18215 [Methyloglobulus sp.]